MPVVVDGVMGVVGAIGVEPGVSVVMVEPGAGGMVGIVLPGRLPFLDFVVGLGMVWSIVPMVSVLVVGMPGWVGMVWPGIVGWVVLPGVPGVIVWAVKVVGISRADAAKILRIFMISLLRS
ncbi:hypothetical protein ASE75_08940 [Sphingomonas sp. Leaf17]|uniref:hypothetical protein n=1 Tax=Sphingomonas sp. Leaf17 TaxID=1735683 RepID=UPI0006F52763|nr:hypothetical protein [Sphingomonas sp. Leaf17]KQM64130.1 hypothetical protein ASE75_08940 [Sphingomonas sp. Leaf17]